MSKTKPAIFTGLLAVVLTIGLTSGFAISELNQENYATDIVKTGGWFTVVHADAFGAVKSVQEVDNLVVNEGLECMGDSMFGATECVGETLGGFNYISVGTGAVAPVDTDTALGAESGTCARVQDASPSMNTVTDGERLITLSSVFTGASCNGEVYAEVGLHDASSAGNMYATALLPNPIELFVPADTLTVTYSIQFNN